MNSPNAWLQFALFLGALLLLTKPLGLYLVRVLDPRGQTFLDRVVGAFERLTQRFCGVDPAREQNWLATPSRPSRSARSASSSPISFLRFQHLLPLNPQNLPGLSAHLAFNTAASFTTNTNRQSYGGESILSCFSQVVTLTFHNFVSAAAGIAIAAALVRGIARQTTLIIGNFWTDLVRVTYYLLALIRTIFALAPVSQGIIQNFKPYTVAKTYEPYSIQVSKLDAAGQPVLAADGKTPAINRCTSSCINWNYR